MFPIIEQIDKASRPQVIDAAMDLRLCLSSSCMCVFPLMSVDAEAWLLSFVWLFPFQFDTIHCLFWNTSTMPHVAESIVAGQIYHN